MAKTLEIKNGDAVQAYKDYLIKSVVSMNIWKGMYPKAWQKAGGAVTTIGGREYFGGRFNIDAIATSELENLLTLTGVDDSSWGDIRSAYNDDQVDHVYMNFKPHQTFTLDGLKWFLNHTVEETLINEGVTQFQLVHEVIETTQRDTPLVPYTEKQSANEMYSYALDADNLPVPDLKSPSLITTNTDVDEALRMIYILTNWFEDNETVTSTIVEEAIDNGFGGNNYKYTTTITISLTNTVYLTNNADVEALFNNIHLSDDESSYITTSNRGAYKKATIKNNAGYLWSLEYTYQGDSGYNNFDDGSGLVIYSGDNYWIDKEKWLSASPQFCLITLGRLINIGVQQKSCNFWCTVGRFFAGFFNAIIGVFGEAVYAVFYLAGLWLIDVLADNGVFSKHDVMEFKRISKKVMGTIALAVVTFTIGAYLEGVSEASTLATQASNAGVSGAGYTATATDTLLNNSMSALAATGNGTVGASTTLGELLLTNIDEIVDIGMDIYQETQTGSNENYSPQEIPDKEESFSAVYSEPINGVDLIDVYFESMGNTDYI